MSKQEHKHLKGNKCPYCNGETRLNYMDDTGEPSDYECMNCGKMWELDGSPLDVGFGWKEEEKTKNKFKRFRKEL